MSDAVVCRNIHWHGLFQNGTNYMDGTTGITECGIPPGRSFVYKCAPSPSLSRYPYGEH